jgi:peptide/nickel transport system ATP-binding protein
VTGAPLATVEGLRATTSGDVLLRDVTFGLAAGRVTALVGPSGSGKTTTALALLGESGPGVRLAGQVTVAGHRVVADGADPRELAEARRRVRGRVVGFLPQHVDQALNPARRVGSVLDEIARTHHPGSPRSGRRRLVTGALRAAHLDDGARLLRRFPHQFSGGQRRRLALAQALLCAPAVLVLDEPTVGLDPETTRQVVRELAGLAATGPAILLLSHDRVVVRALADDVVELRGGRPHRRAPESAPESAPGPAPVEHGPVERAPAPVASRVPAAGARQRDRPAREAPTAPVHSAARPAPTSARPVLVADSVTARHGRGSPVLHGVDLSIGAGECVGLVGPSGSGKTTLARCLAGLHRPDSGRVLLDGRPVPALRRREPAVRRRIQYVWQDVLGSFDEGRPVLGQVARSAVRLRGRTVAEARDEARDQLERLGVAATSAGRRPGELSGGELRRAALARALLAHPDVLICDEITSSLDAERAAAISALLEELRRTRGTALLVISHDRHPLAAAGRVVALREGTVEAEEAPGGQIGGTAPSSHSSPPQSGQVTTL